MRQIFPLTLGATILLSGCGIPPTSLLPAPPAVTSVIPSTTGIPLAVAALGDYEFVSVQQTGQIFTYNISSGSQVLAGSPYTTPCADPSGLVTTTIAGQNILAVACYDTGSLLTLGIQADGSLSPLGSVSGLGSPYPGIALDGTNVLIPLFGATQSTNGGVAKVSLASPAAPTITGIATLASPPSGGAANPGFLTVAKGYIYVSAGSESYPITTSSTLQVVDEATMTLVGAPLVVEHSPQQLAVQGNVAYAVFYDAMQIESIDVSHPGNLQPLQIFVLANPPGCHALPLLLRGTSLYIGCNAENSIQELNIGNPSDIKPVRFIGDITAPQDITLASDFLLVTSSIPGGSVYRIYIGPTN